MVAQACQHTWVTFAVCVSAVDLDMSHVVEGHMYRPGTAQPAQRACRSCTVGIAAEGALAASCWEVAALKSSRCQERLLRCGRGSCLCVLSAIASPLSCLLPLDTLGAAAVCRWIRWRFHKQSEGGVYITGSFSGWYALLGVPLVTRSIAVHACVRIAAGLHGLITACPPMVSVPP
jgi:hypothetical protein